MPWLNSIGHKVPEPVSTAKTRIVLRAPAVKVSLGLLIVGKLLKGFGFMVGKCVVN